jgi:predicted component of type VI protein secretion system
VLVAVMLARERRWPADTAADGCTELAAALATLPSGLLKMVADAVAALGWLPVLDSNRQHLRSTLSFDSSEFKARSDKGT